ncbi:cytochrome c [Amaricoccus solimangrovi]|uniref:Cytochrome c n=1 Tax=Amaricoccus solimangrovi TaxID=2589815 RepID=A0A501WS84_9RHOB|nr:cytochrome c [Amaricoccus solimangrovi]TPE50944.1 cytochrome c [Amaricoccus solimangrovi]
MKHVFRTALAALLLAAPLASPAAPVTYALPDESATFRPGPGVETAESNCGACHSADYIEYQPPGMGADFWSAEVTKMIKVYGAPISEEDAKAIAAYLAATY